jgi:F420-non-reducing hydrogenase iron-sulfur subunit
MNENAQNTAPQDAARNAPAPQATGETWQPRILAFVCRWCTYAGADLAGTSRLKYPPQIRIIKLPCSGRIDPLFLLRGLEMGADGVLVSGCHPGDCHYMTGNYYARRRWVLFRELLNLVGFDMRRIHFSWVSAAEGAKFVDVVKTVTDAIREAGPFPGFATPIDRRPDIAKRTVIGGNGKKAAAASLDAIRTDLESGAVRAVIGYVDGRRDGVLRPSWAIDAAQAAGLRHAPDAQPSLINYLVRRLREEPEGVYGILAGPNEVRALRMLQADSQVDPERIRVYEQSGQADANAGKEPWDIYGIPSPDRPLEERWNYWTAQFSHCLRCNACRQGCPLCSCNRCITDKTRPRWIDASPTPAGNWIWNVTRAFHHAGHCVDCGGCTAACPAGIPLGALNLHLLRVAEREFGPHPEGEAGERSPLVSYRLEDQAPFIL